MNIERHTKLKATLEQIMHTLTTQYQPEKIILFGSMVDNSVTAWSDIDLLIVKETQLPFLQRLKKVALLCRAAVGVDYLVYTPDELAGMIEDQNPFILDVLKTGEVLYEQRDVPAMA